MVANMQALFSVVPPNKFAQMLKERLNEAGRLLLGEVGAAAIAS